MPTNRAASSCREADNGVCSIARIRARRNDSVCDQRLLLIGTMPQSKPLLIQSQKRSDQKVAPQANITRSIVEKEEGQMFVRTNTLSGKVKLIPSIYLILQSMRSFVTTDLQVS